MTVRCGAKTPRFSNTLPIDFAYRTSRLRMNWHARLQQWLSFILLDHFTVADAYLDAVLNWSVQARVSSSRYPAIKEYHRRLRIRPSIARAYQEELTLYEAELAGHRRRD